jgi:hypothetical protein
MTSMKSNKKEPIWKIGSKNKLKKYLTLTSSQVQMVEPAAQAPELLVQTVVHELARKEPVPDPIEWGSYLHRYRPV